MRRTKSLSVIPKSGRRYRGRNSARNRYDIRSRTKYELEDEVYSNSENLHLLSLTKREDSLTRSDHSYNGRRSFPRDVNERSDYQKFVQNILVAPDNSTKISKRSFEGKERIVVNGYDYCDILWLILKTDLDEFPSSRFSSGCMEQDLHIFETRTNDVVIIDEILNFKALSICRAYDLTLNYMYITDICKVRGNVTDLLEKYDNFLNLFPNTKWMKAFLVENGHSDKISILDDRLNVLNAWLNTVNDLNEKINQFRALFQLDERDVWPHNLDKVMTDYIACESVKDAKEVFQNVVQCSLSLKGMKKVLRRVISISGVTIAKVSSQLMKRVKSYAEAADTTRTTHMNLSANQKTRWESDEASKYGANSVLFEEMGLRSYVPLFKFLVGIRMELILEWLEVRDDMRSSDNKHEDPLIFEAIMEDCRDCVEETILSRRDYAAIVKRTGDMFPDEYDEMLDEKLPLIFTTYLKYLSKRYIAISEEYSDIWTDLEKEWSFSLTLSTSVQMGINYQSSYILSLVSNLFEKCVVSYFETVKWHEVHHYDNSIYEKTKEAVHLCREYSRTLTNVQKKSKCLCALLQTICSHFQIAKGYSLKTDISHLGDMLQNSHTLVETDKCSGVAIVVDEVAIITRSYVELCSSLFNCRKTTAVEGYLMVIPDPESIFRKNWTQRRLRISQGEELYALRQLRNDLVCVMGKFDYNDSGLKKILRFESNNCSAYENIDSHIISAQECLLDLVEKLWKSVIDMKSSFDDEADIGDNVLTMFRQAFYTMFQLHRETYRIIAETGNTYQLKQLIKLSLILMNDWVDFVKESKNNDASYEQSQSFDIDQLSSKNNPFIIPVWSRSAFNFCVFILEKYSNLLNTKQFSGLQSKMNECIKLVACEPLPAVARKDAKKLFSINRRRDSRPSPAPRSRMAAIEKLEKQLSEKSPYHLGSVVIDNAKETNIDNGNFKRDPKWQTFKQIGQGATAQVHTALYIKRNEVVAVKIIKMANIEDASFKNELEVMRQLNHPNLVKYIDHEFNMADREVHIAMELCVYTLKTLCEGPIIMKDIRTYVNNLLQAVAYIHEKHIVHRDIKPDNIYLDRMGRLKLGDFGLSIFLQTTVTFFGEILKCVGTFQFMAPEVATFGKKERGVSKGYGRAADIWSIGCVLLNMVTSERPWKGYHQAQLLYALGMGTLPNMKKVTDEVVKEFLLKCLEYDPDVRKKAVELLQEDFVNLNIDYEGIPVPDSNIA